MSGIKIYDWNIASTGLTELVVKELELDYAVSVLKDNYRPEFMPTTEPFYLIKRWNGRQPVSAK